MFRLVSKFTRRQEMKQVFALLALLVLTMALTAWSNFAQSSPPKAENQPHMSAALDHLQQAEKELNAANQDKGGHRKNALSLIKRGIPHLPDSRIRAIMGVSPLI